MDTPARIKLGRQIKKLREKAKLTQEKLAGTVGIDYKYLQKIEGKTPPAIRIDTIEKLAKALKVPTWKLLQFKD